MLLLWHATGRLADWHSGDTGNARGMKRRNRYEKVDSMDHRRSLYGLHNLVDGAAMIRLQRIWCQLFHRRVTILNVCCTCGLRFEHPALDGPLLQVKPTRSVTLVEAPRAKKRVVALRKPPDCRVIGV